MRFVSSSIYHKAIQRAQSEGLDPELFAHHQNVDEIRKKDKYIPIDNLFEIYELADQHLTPGFGLRQGQQLNSEDYGTLGLSWRTCWRAKEILERTERFMVLVTDHGSISVEEANGITRVNLKRDAHRVGVQIANEATFVMITGVIREVTGKEIHPVNVSFQHPAKDRLSFSDYFHCPVQFGQKQNLIEFETDSLDIPTIKADQSIHQFLVARMDEEKKGIQTGSSRLFIDIHKLISEALPGGIPSVIQVAEFVGMSTRTLKRRLADKGLTFRDFVQQIQREISVDLIQNSSQSMAEIAFQTGFSEQSAFNRAFKRWTGQSPAEFRSQ